MLRIVFQLSMKWRKPHREQAAISTPTFNVHVGNPNTVSFTVTLFVYSVSVTHTKNVVTDLQTRRNGMSLSRSQTSPTMSGLIRKTTIQCRLTSIPFGQFVPTAAYKQKTFYRQRNVLSIKMTQVRSYPPHINVIDPRSLFTKNTLVNHANFLSTPPAACILTILILIQSWAGGYLFHNAWFVL